MAEKNQLVVASKPIIYPKVSHWEITDSQGNEPVIAYVDANSESVIRALAALDDGKSKQGEDTRSVAEIMMGLGGNRWQCKIENQRFKLNSIGFQESRGEKQYLVGTVTPYESGTKIACRLEVEHEKLQLGVVNLFFGVVMLGAWAMALPQGAWGIACLVTALLMFMSRAVTLSYREQMKQRAKLILENAWKALPKY